MLRFLKSTMLMAAVALAAFVVSPTNADACAGLIGSNGAVNLGSTTTLAAYHDGVEHYVTAFEFQGGGGQFGTLIPLPGVPSKVERGGAWTLQRLLKETDKRVFAQPTALESRAGAANDVQRCALLGPRLSERQRSSRKGEGGEDVPVLRRLRLARCPPEATGDHQVDRDEQIVFQREGDALADASQSLHALAAHALQRRIHGAQQKWRVDVEGEQLLPQDSSLQRFDVDRDIRKLRHLQPAAHLLHVVNVLGAERRAEKGFLANDHQPHHCQQHERQENDRPPRIEHQ